MTSILAGQPILIVEDEPLIAFDVAYSFQNAGAQVVTAFSLDEALELIEEHSWRGAVLDYWLNGQNCSRICEWLLERAVPFVICSGFDQITGPCAKGVHVPKPANADEILSTLERLADPHRQVQPALAC